MDPGVLIRRARLRAGLSQAELARRAGTSQPAVARREQGHDEPLVSTLRRMLYACGEVLELSTRPLPSSPRRTGIQERRREVVRLLDSRGARNPRLFGSVARGEDDEGSDVDLLVDLNGGRWPASRLMTVLGLSEELARLLGFRVDVASPETLRPDVRDRALTEAVPL